MDIINKKINIMEYTKEQLIDIFENFICEIGQWNNFKEWLEEREGVKPLELGFSDDE